MFKSRFIKRNNNVHGQSFSVKHDKLPHFLKLWHHHNEFELVYIIQSEGTRFVGDSIAPFNPGDVVLLGDQLPHKWQNNPEYFEGQDLVAEAVIIHFEKSFLANALTETIELLRINEMILSSNRGLVFRGASNKEVGQRMMDILKMEPGSLRLISLIDLLRILSEESEVEHITSAGYVNSAYERDSKLRKVNDYVMNNFQSDISLDDVSELVSMNKSSFSRFFKKNTEKGFSKYLNEIRIGYACKLLQRGSKSISEICFESGFNNISNFNHRFKELIGCTPSEYLKTVSE